MHWIEMLNKMNIPSYHCGGNIYISAKEIQGINSISTVITNVQDEFHHDSTRNQFLISFQINSSTRITNVVKTGNRILAKNKDQFFSHCNELK